MIRVLNFFCVALMGLSILALYHVSERTRVARVELSQATRQIAAEHATINVLEAEWEHVASPERIGTLAQSKLGLDNTATVQLSSFEQLPRRGDDSSSLSNAPLRRASAVGSTGRYQQIAANSGTP